MRCGLVSFFLIWLSGCNIISPHRIIPQSHVADTPTHLLNLLTEAYINKDIILYQSLLADSFLFYASPNLDDLQGFRQGFDAGGNPIYYWTQEEEKARHIKMFDALNGAENISLSMSISEDMWENWVVGDSLVGMKTRENAINDITLNLTFQGQEYEITKGRAVFKVKKMKSTGIWVISEWYDLGTSSN